MNNIGFVITETTKRSDIEGNLKGTKSAGKLDPADEGCRGTRSDMEVTLKGTKSAGKLKAAYEGCRETRSDMEVEESFRDVNICNGPKSAGKLKPEEGCREAESSMEVNICNGSKSAGKLPEGGCREEGGCCWKVPGSCKGREGCCRNSGRICQIVLRGKCEPKKKGVISGVLIALALTAAISGFISSFEQTIFAAAMLLIREELDLTPIWHAVIIGTLYLAGAVGTLTAGQLSEFTGRRDLVLTSSVLYVASSVISSTSAVKEQLLVARIIAGFSIGTSALVVPIYLSEIAPAACRGRISLSFAFLYILGQLIATLLGATFVFMTGGWRYMIGLGSLPALFQLLGLLLLPESPRWLAFRGRVCEARASLEKLRAPEYDWEEEFQGIICDIRANAGKCGIKAIFRSVSVRRAFVIGALVFLSQPLTGVIMFLAYSGSIVTMAGIADKTMAMYVVAAVVCVGLVGLIVGILLVEKVGRRPLVLTSLALIVTGLLIAAGTLNYAHIHAADVMVPNMDPMCDFDTCGDCTSNPDCGFCFSPEDPMQNSCVPADDSFYYQLATSGQCANSSLLIEGDFVFAYDWCPFQYAWIIILGFSIFVFGFALGMGPLPWTINSEIFPQWARTMTISFTLTLNWLTNLILTFSFLSLTYAIYKHGVFYLLASINAVFFAVFLFLLPETGGRRLEDVECLFRKPLGVGIFNYRPCRR